MDYSSIRRMYVYLVVVLVLVFVGCIITVATSDREAPVISINQALLPEAFSDDMELSELLTGVTAYDKADGDVTNAIFVVNMIVLGSGDKVKVTYAVRDSSNNIAQESTVIGYTGSHSYIDVVNDNDILESLTAQDNQNVQEETTPEEPTEQQVIMGGYGTPVPINKEAVDSTGVPQIELKYTDYTIHAGEEFSTIEALDMVSATYDDSEAVSNRIMINGIANVDVNTVGDYVLSYSVSDTAGNRSEAQILTVHVVE